MERDAIPQRPVASADTALSPREQIAQQIASNAGGGDGGGIFSQLSGNPFFTAGFGLAALGLALRTGQKGLVRAGSLLRRRLLVDVEITRHDDSYQWFLQWMSSYSRAQVENSASTNASQAGSLLSRLLNRFTPGIHHLSMQTSKETLPNGAPHTRFALVPGPGRHILRYKNAFILVQRERDANAVDIASGRPFETVTMTTLYSHRRVFESLFREAHLLAQRAQEGKTIIYMAEHVTWKQFGEPKRKRPLDSVVLEDGVKERIVEDVRTFLSARNWYLDRGIPYRRGYLLYGPPGTGKSSFIQALAGELDFNIAMLNLSQRGLTDDRLNLLLTNIPVRTLVLLEDADVAFANRRRPAEDGYTGATVTFSGLLNALDGVASAEERIIFLTTNHVERMDEALTRPGRVDMTVRLGEATESQVEQLWERFYSGFDMDGSMKRRFVEKLRKLGVLGQVSTASLQGLFLFSKNDPQRAINMAEGLLPEHDVRQSTGMQQGAT